MFSVMSAKIAKQANEKYSSYNGWFVFDERMNLIYNFKLKFEAIKACERLNSKKELKKCNI